MSTDIAMQTTSYQVGDLSWKLSSEGNNYHPNVTLDVSTFIQGNANEVQTVTIDATGGTFTLTYAGQTTTAIAEAAAATAVQSALEALSNIAVGDVSVAGSAGGPYTVTFTGLLGSQNVAQMTASGASLTGGAGTAVVTTNTGGAEGHYPNGYIPSGVLLGKITASSLYGPYDDTASDGRQTATGILIADVRVVRANGSVAVKVGSGQLVRGDVKQSKLPIQTGPGSADANGIVDLKHIRFE